VSVQAANDRGFAPPRFCACRVDLRQRLQMTTGGN